MSIKKPKQKASKKMSIKETQQIAMQRRAEKKAAKRAIKKELALFNIEAPKIPVELPPIAPLAELIVKVADMRKATDIVHMCVKNISSITDDVIILTGSSSPHLKALTDHLGRELLEQLNIRLRAVDGRADTGWVLLDFGNAIVHIFTEEVRKHYDLERLWSDAPLMDTLRKIHAKLNSVKPPTKRVTMESLMATKPTKKVATKAPVAKKEIVKKATPKVATKVVAKVAVKTPAAKTPVAKKVAVKTPVAKVAVKAPAAKTPVAKKVAVKTPVAKVAVKAPAAKKSVAKVAVKAPAKKAPAKKPVAKK